MKEDRQKKILYMVSLVSAAVVAGISLFVLVVWHLKNPVFIENYYWVFYMQHTTALLFLFSSSGVFMAARGYKKGTELTGLFVFFVALVIMLEYVTGYDFHIDQLLLTDYVHPDTLYPGRPAPNTSLAFLCIGAALVLLVTEKKPSNDARMALVELTGFVVFALGAYAVAGYIQSVEQAYAWGTDTRMSVHTAFANIALGSGLLSLSWYYQKREIARVPLWLPALLCFLALQADLAAPSGIIASVVYIPLVFCSLWFTFDRTVFIFAAIATMLAVLRYFMLPPEYMTEEVLVNRFLTVAVLWFVAVLIHWKRLIDSKLQHSEKYLRAIVDHTIEGLIVIDSKGTVKSFNPACERIFGYDANEVIGNNITMLMPSPYQNEHDGYLANYLRTGEKKIIGIGREVEGRRKDGTVFPMDLSVSEMGVEGKRFFSGIVRDITERKEAEEELLRSNTELERFAFVAAHDLQEPLRIIMKSSEFLQEDYGEDLDEGAVKYIGHIRTAAERMRVLVRDLLEYSRIGNEERKYENVSVADSVRMALNNLEQDIEEMQEAEITLDDDFPHVNANAVQVVRIYQNLIGNALKYCRKDMAPRIHLGVKERGKKWVFSVEDNGLGIEAQYLEQIFVPFKRLHTNKEYPGTGIGLAMCKRIAESHGGDLWVESEFGKGSIFYFTLPKA